MQTQIIDGKKLSREILEKIKKEVALLPFPPLFCDVLVEGNHVSEQYVRMKQHTAESVGIKFHNAHFKGDIKTEELVREIKKINDIENMCGVIVQLPIPLSIDKKAVLDAIDPTLDVDCLGTLASEEFYNGNSSLGFPTALACMELLDSLDIDLNPPAGGKKIVVLGQGELVGKPVTALLNFRGLSPVVVRSKTENSEEIIKNADVIISGMGKGGYIKGDMVKPGVVLIDAGTSEAWSAVVGDVDFESCKHIAGYISPVPGGVGPMTIAMLLTNVLKVAKEKSLVDTRDDSVESHE